MKVTQLDCLCVILLHLLHTAGSEKFEVLGPTDPIVAVAGDDIILPCYLKPNISAEDMTVDWLNLDFKDSRVYRYQNHRIIRDYQIPYYRGRTSLFEEELWRGNTSLKLTRVQGTDEGRYKCFIKAKSWYDDFTIQVLVKAVGSKPVVSIEGHREGGMGLLCESEGWHPEPELAWLDSKGVHLSAGPPETHRDFKGFYRVKQHVIVQETDTNRFTCRVQQSRINEKMETEVHLPSELFDYATPLRMAFILLCCLGAVTVIGLALAIYCICNQKDYHKKEKDEIMEEKDVLRKEKDDLKKEKDEIMEEKDVLRKDKDDLKKEKDEIMEEKDVLTEKLEVLSKEKAVVEKDLTSQLDVLRKEKDDLKKEKDDLTGKLDDLRKERDNLRKERVKLWEENNEIREEKANLSAQTTNLKEETVRLRGEKAVVEKDLTSQLDGIKKERIDLWEQNNYLTERLGGVTLDPDLLGKGRHKTGSP